MSVEFNLFKAIHLSKKIITIIIQTIIVLVVCVNVMLLLPPVQEFVRSKLEKELCLLTGTNVSIGHINNMVFSNLDIRDITLFDLENDTILRAKKIAVVLEPLSLLNGKIEISNCQLIGTHIHIDKDSVNAPFNFQFLIDRFKSKDSIKKSFDYTLALNNVVIRNSHLSYRVKNVSAETNHFSPHDLSLIQLNASIALKEFSKDSLDFHIKRFSFKERSGIVLNNFTIKAIGNNHSIQISDVMFDFNRSKLEIDSTRLTYQWDDDPTKLLHSLHIKTSIHSNGIRLDDLAPLVPALRNFETPLNLKASISGNTDNLNIDQLQIHSDRMVHFNSDLQLFNLKEPRQSYVYAKIQTLNVTSNALHTLFYVFNKKETIYPYALQGVGDIRFDGELSGYATDFIAYGHLHTQVGSLFIDLQTSPDEDMQSLAFNGSLKSSNLNLNQLIEKDDLLGNTSFDINVNGSIVKGQKPTGTIRGLISQFDFKTYPYKDIHFKGSFDSKGYRGELSIDDPHLDFLLNGDFNVSGSTPKFNLTASFNRIHLNDLRLLKNSPPIKLSFGIRSELSIPEFNDIYGYVDIQNLFVSVSDKQLSYDRISIVSDSLPDSTRAFRIESPFLMTQIKGQFVPRDISKAINNTLHLYLPSIFKTGEWGEKKTTYFDYNIDIAETSALSSVLNLPVLLPQPAKIYGKYRGAVNEISLNLLAPKIKLGNTVINGAQIYVQSDSVSLNATTRINSQTKKGVDFNVILNNKLRRDSLFTNLLFNNTKESTVTGEINAVTSFLRTTDKTPLHTQIKITPSDFIINDSIWKITESTIEIDTSRVFIQNFNILGDNQRLSINGEVSKDPTDMLRVQLEKISLDYIFDIIKIQNVDFGGRATGLLHATDLFSKPNLAIDTLYVSDFAFNKTRLGNLRVHTFFGNEKKAIHFDAKIANSNDSITKVKGYYAIPTDSLELKIQANDVNVEMLRPFIGQILVDLTGHASGYVHLYGPTKYLSVEGKVKAREVNFGVDVLGTRYTFSDSILLRKDGIDIINAKAFDKERNQALVSGKLFYEYFKNISYNFRFTTDRLLAYDQPTASELPFGATVYASGEVTIDGDESRVNINAGMRPEIGSIFNFSINRPTTATNYEFLTFVKPRDRYEQFLIDSIGLKKKNEIQPEETQKTIVNMEMELDINPNLKAEVIMDETTGDAIKATGNGNIRAVYSSVGNDLKLFGGYTIDQGSYNFSLQNVINKNFTISSGSSLSFNGGDYRNIGLSVNALYTVTANISDLDASLKNEISRTTLPVQCILKISGNLSNPTLAFDVAIPSVSSEINRRVKNIISSDDMMNRQIIYLLVLGKFYTPDYMNYSSGRNNEMAAIASSAVSSQLNNLLGKMIDNWNIGTNFRSQKGDFSDIEVELALSGQLLDNRLLINGNFGYRDKRTNLTQTNFIGDIDVEYKLTQSGIFRLKAYNHTNDRPYYYKPALTTQGIGFVFKKDIKPLYFFLRKKPKLTTPDTLLNQQLSSDDSTGSPTPYINPN